MGKGSANFLRMSDHPVAVVSSTMLLIDVARKAVARARSL